MKEGEEKKEKEKREEITPAKACTCGCTPGYSTSPSYCGYKIAEITTRPRLSAFCSWLPDAGWSPSWNLAYKNGSRMATASDVVATIVHIQL